MYCKYTQLEMSIYVSLETYCGTSGTCRQRSTHHPHLPLCITSTHIIILYIQRSVLTGADTGILSGGCEIFKIMSDSYVLN